MKYVARKGLLLTVIMVFLATFFSLNALSATYTVQGVRVDTTAETAVDAREQALKKAQILAFNKLLKSIVLKQDQDKIPPIEQDQIETFIKTYSVEDEKLTDTRYLANYRFSILKDPVNSFLSAQNIIPLAYEQKKVLAIPLYTTDSETLIDQGLWYNNWKMVLSQYKETYILPLFDIEDQFKIKAFVNENSATGLKELLHKYGADNLAIVWLKTSLTDDHLFEIETYILDDQQAEPNKDRTPPFWMPEDQEQIKMMINQLIEDLQEKEKYKTIDKKNFERRIQIQVACHDIQCVNTVKNDLYLIKNIKDFSVSKADNKKITYTVVYEGKFKVLQKQLENKMYKVSFTDTGILIDKIMQNNDDNS